MNYTDNYHMKLPAQTDYYNVDDFNDNFEKIDELLNEATVTVDSALSSTSENPVQNKAITLEINDLKNSVGDGKALVASAITEKGVATASDATFETMANNIAEISSGSSEVSGTVWGTSPVVNPTYYDDLTTLISKGLVQVSSLATNVSELQKKLTANLSCPYTLTDYGVKLYYDYGINAGLIVDYYNSGIRVRPFYGNSISGSTYLLNNIGIGIYKNSSLGVMIAFECNPQTKKIIDGNAVLIATAVNISGNNSFFAFVGKGDDSAYGINSLSDSVWGNSSFNYYVMTGGSLPTAGTNPGIIMQEDVCAYYNSTFYYNPNIRQGSAYNSNTHFSRFYDNEEKNYFVLNNRVVVSVSNDPDASYYNKIIAVLKEDVLVDEDTGITILSSINSTNNNAGVSNYSLAGVLNSMPESSDIVYDTVPTENSDNLIKSGAIYSALQDFASAIA